MRNRTPWILLSRAADDGSDATATAPLLRQLAALGIRCDHVDDGRGVNGVSPVLITEERRFEGHAAIAAFLQHATREIARLEGRPVSVVRRAPGHLVVLENDRRRAAYAA